VIRRTSRCPSTHLMRCGTRRPTHGSGRCPTNVYVTYFLPTSLSSGGKKMWCLPRLTPQFRARMDDVLTLYTEPLPAGEEVHCFDETPKQLLGTPAAYGTRNQGKAAE
jgi:hypothetical protein